MDASELPREDGWPPLRGFSAVRWLQLVVVIGFAARVALWLLSEGSNDIRTWERFARDIAEGGVLQLYSTNDRFNHPPLMGLWAHAALRLSDALGVGFAYAFKLLPMAADAIAIPVLLGIMRHKGATPVVAWRVAAIFSTSIAAILVAAYHGNTDSVCALLTLLAVFLVDRKERPLLAGLIFAAALNVKLIPLVLAPALFVIQARSLRHAVLWCVGVGVGMLPFVPPLLVVGEDFYRNAIAYNSFPERWGLHFVFESGFKLSHAGELFRAVDVYWAYNARYVIMAASLAIGVWARRWNVSALNAGAMIIATFLVLAPGVGVQYFVFPVLLTVVVDARRGLHYGLVAGAFLAVIYFHFSPLEVPLTSTHRGRFPMFAALMGIPVWVLLVQLVVSRLRTARGVRGHDEAAA